MAPSFYNLEGAALEEAARRATIVPLVREIAADLWTPVGAFLLLASRARRAFLLESAVRGETVGRWSFLGWDPVLTIRAGDGWAEELAGENRRSLPPDRPFDLLRRAVAGQHVAAAPQVPPFAGGLVGYLGYDAVRWFERLPQRKEPSRDPWFEFSLYDSLLAFDHLRHRILAVVNLFPARRSLALEEKEARQRAEAIAAALVAPASLEANASRGTETRETFALSLTPKDRFLESVRRLQEHIRRGDIFQAVLSQRFVQPLRTAPFSVYRALRRINPSPYMFFLKSEELALAGSSPEMLVRVWGVNVETHPIAGTRPRGETEEEDRALEAQLVADPKEKAEHLMLVDLARNDLGRVAEPGSVRVPRYAEVERYSHVMHLVSRVTGRLRPGRDGLDALVASFPAGTVTGAPKIRAMELLDELEPVPRGPYAGSVAYLDFRGNLDSCISIRLLVAREGRAEVQAGAGIVADSSPEAEWLETVNKARAIHEAIAWAERVLG